MVRPTSPRSSLVWAEAPSVPSWFWVLELCPPLEDSVEAVTLKPRPCSVQETFTGPPAGEVTDDEEDTDTSDLSVLSSVTLRGGVESEVSSDVAVYRGSVALGCPVKLWVPPELRLKELVLCCRSVVSPLSVLVDRALRV